MSIYKELYEIEDSRVGGTLCSLNCYLEDYISNQADPEDHKTLILKALFETDKDLRLITDLKAKIDKNQISNIIIRYKDVYKLKNKAITVPFIVYSKTGKVIVIHDDYVTAKALYFLLSDEPNCLVNNRKDSIVIGGNLDPKETVRFFNELNGNANKLQKEIDSLYFKNIDEAISEVTIRTEKNNDSIIKYKHSKDETRLSFIDSKIEEIYLLKKFIYIQYMLDKDTLNNKHGGDIKKHRLDAKLQADSIKFIPYHKMWEYTEKK